MEGNKVKKRRGKGTVGKIKF